MALNESKIKGEIKDAFMSVMYQEEGREDALDKLAGKIAKTVVDAIKSADIKYTTGLTTLYGPVTGTFGNTIQ